MKVAMAVTTAVTMRVTINVTPEAAPADKPENKTQFYINGSLLPWKLYIQCIGISKRFLIVTSYHYVYSANFSCIFKVV